MDFANVTGLTIPVNGVQKEVLSITDSLNRVIWQKSAVDYSEPFYIEALSLGLVKVERVGDNAPDFTLKWSFDKTNWNSALVSSGISILVDTGDKVWFVIDSNSGQTAWQYNREHSNYVHFTSVDAQYNIGGNVMSLIDPDFANDYSTITVPRALASVFSENTAIVSASKLLLPADIMTEECYGHMFDTCTTLVTPPPILPATHLAEDCYWGMFSGCTSLTSAPALPATTLVITCYEYMFYRCTSLTTAPALPATTLARYCYTGMFYQCTSLNDVTIYADDISAYGCLSRWLYNVAATGTFHNLGSATYPSGYDGIPSGWTEVNN